MIRELKLSDISNVKHVWGHPINDYEPCCTLCADLWIYKGDLYMDGMGGVNSLPIRIKPEKSKRDDWGSLLRKCRCSDRGIPSHLTEFKRLKSER